MWQDEELQARRPSFPERGRAGEMYHCEVRCHVIVVGIYQIEHPISGNVMCTL